MINEFESFVVGITRAHKYVQYIKKYEGLAFGLKGFHVMCIYFLYKNPSGLTVTELSQRCCEDKATVSRTLDALTRRGYVIRQDTISGTHRRSRVRLSREGRRIAGKLNDLIEDITNHIGEGFTEEEKVLFYKMLYAFDKRLADYCTELGKRKQAGE